MNEQLLAEKLHQAAPMVRNFAYKHGLDFDDLMQEAALVILEELERKRPGVRCPLAYLQTAILHHLLDLLRKHGPTVSLDVPLGDSELTLLALLATSDSVVHDEAHEDQRQAALYAALHELPLEEQRYLREVYGLNAFHPVPPTWPYPANDDRSRNAMSIHAFRHLRRNASLREAVCHE